ncbi:hypothetical protein ACWCQ1_43300 [Streptomyces sp. NPDC002144]
MNHRTRTAAAPGTAAVRCTVTVCRGPDDTDPDADPAVITGYGPPGTGP